MTDDDLAGADWNEMMNAVKIRLSLTVNEMFSQPETPPACHEVPRYRSSLLECVDSLGKVQVKLNQEVDRNQRLKDEITELRSALLKAWDDLVSIQAHARRVRHKASHDSLTLLPNQAYFRDRLERALVTSEASGLPLAVLYLDLDGFKFVNDSRGHAVGDELLRIVAARINQAVRMDDVVCRLGGDEFACLLGGPANRAQLSQLACKLFDSVLSTCKIGAFELAVRPMTRFSKVQTPPCTTPNACKPAMRSLIRSVANQGPPQSSR
jgi:diguanylate cyclase